ncbi:MAG: hypothetical protein M3P85_10555, partial [Actinomycetota bacterium]|nr:hypothetical protein [Actinomycetota bacterium]
VLAAVAVAAAGLGRPSTPTIAAPAIPPGRPKPAPSQPVVEHAGRRYAMGRPGDVALLGDWDCDGAPTPALYRPSTGEAFVFRSWAEPGSPVQAHRAGRHRRGGVATVAADGEGCDRLSVAPHENA